LVETLFLEAVTDDIDDRFLLSLVLFIPSREDEDNISLTNAFCEDFLAFNDDEEAVIIRDAVLEYCPEDTSNDDERLLFLLLLV